MKQGENSLRWDWRQGEELVIRHGIGDIARRGGFHGRASFSVWIYVEDPVTGALTFEFREGKDVTGSFRFPLGFTGWRQGRPHYDAFPAGRPTADVDNIRIVAPRGVRSGTVFIDLIKYNTLTYVSRGLLPEEEARWQPPEPDERRFPKPRSVTAAEQESIQALLVTARIKDPAEQRVNILFRHVEALGVRRHNDGVSGGPGIDRLLQYCCKVGERGAPDQQYWSDENGPTWPPGIQNPTGLSTLAWQLSAAHHNSKEPEERQRLADAFLLVEDHLYDQGMQAGSGFHWNWWYGGLWAEAVFMMRDVLASAGRLPRQCDYFLWNWDASDLFTATDPPSHMDFFSLRVPRLLQACLMQPEPTEQVRWLRAFKAMLERSILQPGSALKVDGSTYHHKGHYFGYAQYAVPRLAAMVQMLSGTPWRLSPNAHERIRRAALAQRLFCNQVDFPLSLSGRSPFSAMDPQLRPFGLDALARSGTPDGRQPVDLGAAAAYLRLVPGAIDNAPYRALQISPEKAPTGTYIMPYASLLSHRRANWLASVRGQSKYSWGSERQGKVNCFGYFQGLGALEILSRGDPVSADASGRAKEGWDWRRYEGTTVPQLPLEQIERSWTGLAYSLDAFAGGVSHRGRHGLFGMALNQPLPGGGRLRGRKSWLFCGSKILCLGSAISCEEATAPTQTTLCQKRLPRDGKGEPAEITVDGSAVRTFPAKGRLDPRRDHWFLDPCGTGYFVPRGQKLTVARLHQTSRDSFDRKDTEGDFLTAWIDHGKSPTSGAYGYVVMVETTAEDMRRYARAPSFHVLQRDENAHIVWDAAGGRWGAALFAPQEVSPYTVGNNRFDVKAVDRACLVMAERLQGASLVLSVADPDLNLVGDVSQPRALRMTLQGRWKLHDARARVCAWELPEAKEGVKVISESRAATLLEILCQRGATYELRLVAR